MLLILVSFLTVALAATQGYLPWPDATPMNGLLADTSGLITFKQQDMSLVSAPEPIGTPVVIPVPGLSSSLASDTRILAIAWGGFLLTQANTLYIFDGSTTQLTGTWAQTIQDRNGGDCTGCTFASIRAAFYDSGSDVAYFAVVEGVLCGYFTLEQNTVINAYAQQCIASGAADSLDEPSSITVSLNGDILVADPANGAVSALSPSALGLTVDRRVGGGADPESTDPSQVLLQEPYVVATAGDYVYIVERIGNRLRKYDTMNYVVVALPFTSGWLNDVISLTPWPSVNPSVLLIVDAELVTHNAVKVLLVDDSGGAQLPTSIVGISVVTGTLAPLTPLPPTAVPPTPQPPTAAPPTPAPTTAEPPTPALTTAEPPTPAPTTAEPPTPIPSTAEPPTPAPTTAEPPTAIPSTAEPLTPLTQTPSSFEPSPTTMEPSTAAPTAGTTSVPSTDAVTGDPATTTPSTTSPSQTGTTAPTSAPVTSVTAATGVPITLTPTSNSPPPTGAPPVATDAPPTAEPSTVTATPSPLSSSPTSVPPVVDNTTAAPDNTTTDTPAPTSPLRPPNPSRYGDIREVFEVNMTFSNDVGDPAVDPSNLQAAIAAAFGLPSSKLQVTGVFSGSTKAWVHISLNETDPEGLREPKWEVFAQYGLNVVKDLFTVRLIFHNEWYGFREYFCIAVGIILSIAAVFIFGNYFIQEYLHPTHPDYEPEGDNWRCLGQPFAMLYEGQLVYLKTSIQGWKYLEKGKPEFRGVLISDIVRLLNAGYSVDHLWGPPPDRTTTLRITDAKYVRTGIRSRLEHLFTGELGPEPRKETPLAFGTITTVRAAMSMNDVLTSADIKRLLERRQEELRNKFSFWGVFRGSQKFDRVEPDVDQRLRPRPQTPKPKLSERGQRTSNEIAGALASARRPAHIGPAHVVRAKPRKPTVVDETPFDPFEVIEMVQAAAAAEERSESPTVEFHPRSPAMEFRPLAPAATEFRPLEPAVAFHPRPPPATEFRPLAPTALEFRPLAPAAAEFRPESPAVDFTTSPEGFF